MLIAEADYIAQLTQARLRLARDQAIPDTGREATLKATRIAMERIGYVEAGLTEEDIPYSMSGTIQTVDGPAQLEKGLRYGRGHASRMVARTRVFVRADDTTPDAALSRFVYFEADEPCHDIILQQRRRAVRSEWINATPQTPQRFILRTPELENSDKPLQTSTAAWFEISSLNHALPALASVRRTLQVFRAMGLEQSTRPNEWPRAYYRDCGKRTELYSITRNASGDLTVSCGALYRDKHRDGHMTERNLYTMPLAQFINDAARQAMEHHKKPIAAKLPARKPKRGESCILFSAAASIMPYMEYADYTGPKKQKAKSNLGQFLNHAGQAARAIPVRLLSLL